MSFADALLAMQQGYKIRLPWWKGYWYMEFYKPRIHYSDYEDFKMFSEENKHPFETMSFMTTNCWEIVPD